MIRGLLILLFTCACMNMQAQVIINTIAGKGKTSGFSGDGGPASVALLHDPQDICLDRDGNIYFTDAFNARVRRIDAVTGIITTIAGTGEYDYSGDSGPATNAALFFPTSICLDRKKNIYITDVLNRRIRKIDAISGVISTIAGNGNKGSSGDGALATNAEINGVTGIYIDKNDNIFIADNENHNIRKIAFNGIITSVAGNNTAGYSGDGGLAVNAQFNEPGELFVDSADNIIVTDTKNNVLRKINSKTGLISTIAGTGVQGHTGDNGPAVSAALYQPFGLFIDASNNIYFTEYWTGTIRKINQETGIITTVAGKGIIGFSGDEGPAINAEMAAAGIWLDHHGAIYIADIGNHVVRKVCDTSLDWTGVAAVQKGEVKIYPNPAYDEVTIEGAKGCDVGVWNMVGQRVYEAGHISEKQEINMNSLLPGVYMIQVSNPSTGHKEVRRVVKE